MDDKELARLLGAARACFGAIALVAPGLATRVWTGPGSDTFGARVLARGLGARDLAIGMGTLVALEDDEAVSKWLQASAIADVGDVLGLLTSFGQLPRWRRWATLATAGGAAYVGFRLSGELD